jgi:hypothetical protein
MMQRSLRAMAVAGVMGLSLGSAAAQDSPEPRATDVRVIFISVSEDGTTIVDCTGVNCETKDCSGDENEVVSGVPIRIRRLDDGGCASELLTLEQSEEFDEALLELDDLLLIATDPDDNPPPSGGPGNIDKPYLKEDEENQQQVGDPAPATNIRIQAN